MLGSRAHDSADAEEAVAANLATPCTMNARSLLVCALAAAHAATTRKPDAWKHPRTLSRWRGRGERRRSPSASRAGPGRPRDSRAPAGIGRSDVLRRDRRAGNPPGRTRGSRQTGACRRGGNAPSLSEHIPRAVRPAGARRGPQKRRTSLKKQLVALGNWASGGLQSKRGRSSYRSRTPPKPGA